MISLGQPVSTLVVHLTLEVAAPLAKGAPFLALEEEEASVPISTSRIYLTRSLVGGVARLARLVLEAAAGILSDKKF
jgi:hypothetical protein